MVLSQYRRAVGAFPSRHDVEDALNELRNSSFPMNGVSVVVRDADQNDDTGGTSIRDYVENQADEGAVKGAVTGGALGGLTGLLVGLGLLAIPGIGPVMLAGATATALATTISGGAIGAVSGGIIGALVGLGIPEERARVYNERVARGEYLVIIDGTDEEIARAEAILRSRRIQEFGIYDLPNTHQTGTAHGTPIMTSAPTEQVIVTTPRIEDYDLQLDRQHRGVGIFPYRRDAVAALTDLRDSGFEMERVSVIARDADRPEQLTNTDMGVAPQADRIARPVDDNKADEGAKAGAITGGALGGLTGLLVGLGTLAIPGIGPILLAGAGATTLATTLAGGTIGAAAGSLGGALIGLSIPDERAKIYKDRLARGEYLIMVEGSAEEIRRAESILRRHSIQEWDVYDFPVNDSTRTGPSTISSNQTSF